MADKPNLAAAIRCNECGTLFEIPDIEKQLEDIQKLYSEILSRMRFPCPDCGQYQAARGPGPRLRVL